MIINILILCTLLYTWYTIYNKLSFEHFKVRGNYISFSHSLISVCISGLYLQYENWFFLKMQHWLWRFVCQWS